MTSCIQFQSGLFLNKQDHIQWAVEHPRPAGWRARFDKLKVRVYGSTAIANGIVEASDSPEDKLRKTIFTDVFVYRDNRWQTVNAQENEIGNGRCWGTTDWSSGNLLVKGIQDRHYHCEVFIEKPHPTRRLHAFVR
jgi:hypothetical protein